MKTNTCCFIGHRKFYGTDETKSELYEIVEKLIVEEKVDTFFFGSKSEFNTISLNIVTKLKEKYPHIKRIYVRAEYQYISEDYKRYLLQNYEDTYYPEKIRGAGKAAYIERNFEMINNSHFCIFYYDELFAPAKYKNIKSGTKIALKYARNQGKEIINLGKLTYCGIIG